MRKVVVALAWILGLYLLVRGIAELFVLAVHSGPGLVAAALMIAAIVRGRARARRLAASDPRNFPKS